MANYESTARSNRFRVEDEAAFLAWVEQFHNLRVEPEGQGVYVLLETDGEGWPFYRELEQPTTRVSPAGREVEEWEEEMDFPVELSEHLAEGEVAVLEEAGHEKLRYVAAHAVAVNHKGETLHVDLADIYEKVRDAGWSENVSTATY